MKTYTFNYRDRGVGLVVQAAGETPEDAAKRAREILGPIDVKGDVAWDLQPVAPDAIEIFSNEEEYACIYLYPEDIEAEDAWRE